MKLNFKLTRAWSVAEIKQVISGHPAFARTNSPSGLKLVNNALVPVLLIEDKKGNENLDPLEAQPPLSFEAASERISPAARRPFERACDASTRLRAVVARASGGGKAAAAKKALHAAYSAFVKVATAQDKSTFLAYIKGKAAAAAAALQRPAPLLPVAAPAAPPLALPRTPPPSPTSAETSIASSSSSSRSQSPTADAATPLQRVLRASRKLRDAVAGAEEVLKSAPVEEVLASAPVSPQYDALTKALTAIAELRVTLPLSACAGPGGERDAAELRKLAEALAPLLAEGEGALLDAARAGGAPARHRLARELRVDVHRRMRAIAGAARVRRAAKTAPPASAPVTAPAAAWARLDVRSAAAFAGAKLHDDASVPYSFHEGMLSGFAASGAAGSVAAVDNFFRPYSLAQRDGSLNMQLVDAHHSKQSKGGRDARKRIKAWEKVITACGDSARDVHVYILRSGSNTHHRLGLLFHLPTRRFFVYASFISEAAVTWQPRYVPSLPLIAAFRAASVMAGLGGADGTLDARAVCLAQRKRRVQ